MSAERFLRIRRSEKEIDINSNVSACAKSRNNQWLHRRLLINVTVFMSISIAISSAASLNATTWNSNQRDWELRIYWMNMVVQSCNQGTKLVLTSTSSTNQFGRWLDTSKYWRSWMNARTDSRSNSTSKTSPKKRICLSSNIDCKINQFTSPLPSSDTCVTIPTKWIGARWWDFTRKTVIMIRTTFNF